jgi:hypothetical protein
MLLRDFGEVFTRKICRIKIYELIKRVGEAVLLYESFLLRNTQSTPEFLHQLG